MVKESMDLLELLRNEWMDTWFMLMERYGPGVGEDRR